MLHAGTRWLQKWGKELSQGSRLAYFGLTTLLGAFYLSLKSSQKMDQG